MTIITPAWDERLREALSSSSFAALTAFLQKERQAGKTIFPQRGLTFNALKLTAYDDVKVVVVGQDPYHGPGQAHGLSFSVPKGIAVPPSLRNIFKELERDVGVALPAHGCLEGWAQQGVLLLNALLTVEENKPLAHQKQGWEQFTDAVIRELAQRKEPIVFMLWGRHAQQKCEGVRELLEGHHHVLLAGHPSPLSATRFFGCKHFSKANELLEGFGRGAIDWRVGG